MQLSNESTNVLLNLNNSFKRIYIIENIKSKSWQQGKAICIAKGTPQLRIEFGRIL